MRSHGPNPIEPRNGFLRRIDQAAIAALTCAFLVALAIHWLAQGGATRRLIEIDRAPRQTARFTVDINEAEWPELAQLPDIGETLARRIVDSRKTRGPYADHEDLRRVRGIGPRTLEGLRPYLRPMPGSGDVAAR